jgi:hypothetical protein
MAGTNDSFTNPTLIDSLLDGTTTLTGTLRISTGTTITGLFKRNVGLGLVDNTRDIDKPVSTAVQNALEQILGNSVVLSTKPAFDTLSELSQAVSDICGNVISRFATIEAQIAALQAFDASFVATTEQIADGAVTTDKIADGAITAAKIAAGVSLQGPAGTVIIDASNIVPSTTDVAGTMRYYNTKLYICVTSGSVNPQLDGVWYEFSGAQYTYTPTPP